MIIGLKAVLVKNDVAETTFRLAEADIPHSSTT